MCSPTSVRWVAVLRVLAALAWSRWSRPRSPCGCSASGAVGARRSCPGLSAGVPPRSSPSGLTDWDWGADGLVRPHVRDRDPGDDGDRGRRSTSCSRPGRWRSASGPGSSSRPGPMRAIRRRLAVLRRYRELVRLAPSGGLRPVPPVAGRDDAPVADAVGVRLRRVLEEAGGVYVKLGQIAATRVDLVPPEICRRAGQAAEPGPARADTSTSAAVLEAELGRHRRPRVRRVRLGAARGRVDRSDASRPAAIGRGGRRQGPAARHQGDDGARPRRARAARRSRAAAHRHSAKGSGRARCSSSSPRACAPSSTSAAKSTPWWRWRCCSVRRSAVRIPKVYKELCTRRLLVQERFEGFTVADTERLDASAIDRRALAEQLLARHARSGAARRLLPRRSAPREHLRLQRRHARA